MSKNPREIKKKHFLLREFLLSTVASVNLPPPVKCKDAIKMRDQGHFLFDVFTSNHQIQMDKQHS